MTLHGGPEDGAPFDSRAESLSDGPVGAGLVHRIQRGDREAEAELVQRFDQRVRLMASVRIHGSDVASDITQQTMVAVLEALRAGRVREPERLPAFVLSVARNLINNHLRKEARTREVLRDPPERPAESDPGQAALDEERRRQVRDSLRRLRPLDRRILLLTLVEGMNPREIGPIVGLKPEVVRTRKARAIRTMSDEIRKVTRTRPPNHSGTRGLRT